MIVLPQGGEDDGALDLVERDAFVRQLDVEPTLGRGDRLAARARAAHVEVARRHELVPSEQYRALDPVAELAHVARPVVRGEGRVGVVREATDHAVPRAELGEESRREQLRVALALAQRRDADREDVEAVVEVLSELALAHQRSELAVRRRDDLHVDALVLAGADAPDLLLFDGRQQLALQLDGEGRDLVEEERPSSAVSKRPARPTWASVNAPRS